MNKWYSKLHNINSKINEDIEVLDSDKKELDKTFLKSWITDSTWGFSFWSFNAVIIIAILGVIYYLCRRQNRKFRRVSKANDIEMD